MTRDSWQPGMDRATPDGDPFGQLCGKVVLLITEGASLLSRWKPLIAVLGEISHSVVVVTGGGGVLDEIETLGPRVVEFDFRRLSSNPAHEAKAAWTLARILEAESPDAVHMIGMRPVVLGGLALKLVKAPHVVVQVGGEDLAEIIAGRIERLYRAGMLRIIGSLLRRPSSYLLVENPDDLAALRAAGADPGPRFAILGGCGVDPQAFPPLSAPAGDVPIAAFVGGMSKPGGVDLLLDAYGRIVGRRELLGLDLFGSAVDDDADGLDAATLNAACVRTGARWHGHVADIAGVWRHAGIFVSPARVGGGLSRALLEAAACARPLLVTDVPGNRHFVRDGVEGLIVPPHDAGALSKALQLLAGDSDMRVRMGEAARLRLLHGYTEAHVKQMLLASYMSMLGRARGG